MMRFIAAFILSLWFTAQALAVPARVQGGTNSTGFGASIAVTLSAITSGNALALMCVTSTGQPTLTDNGGGGSASYQLLSTSAAQGGLTAYTFYALNVTNSATTVTCTPPSSGQVHLVVDEFSGIATSSAIDGAGSTNAQPTPGTGTDAVTSGSLTTGTNGDLVYGATYNGGTSISAGTGWTAGAGGGGFAFMMSEYQVQSSAGAITATFTIGANNASLTAVLALKPPGGGSSTVSKATLTGVGK